MAGSEYQRRYQDLAITNRLAIEGAASTNPTVLTSDNAGNLRVNAASVVAPAPDRMRRATVASLVTGMQAGHGWVTNGSGVGSSSLNDTADFVIGTQSAKLVSAANGGVCQLRKLAGTSFDLTSKMIRIWIKIDDITHLSQITFYAGSGSLANFYRWTLFTKGSASTYLIQSGEWCCFDIGWGDLANTTGAPNRAAVTDWQIVITDDAAAAVTWHFGGVATVAEPTQWANGVCSVVFDDGWDSQYSTARPVLDKYGYAATHYTIKERIGTAGYHTLAQLQALQDVNGWEIAGHSYTIAAHENANGFNDLSNDQIASELESLRAWLIQNGFRGHQHFAYPHGDFTTTNLPVFAQYVSTGRTILDPTHETWPPPVPLRLRARTVVTSDATATIQTLIDNAFTNKQWLILLFHKIVTSPAVSTEYSTANFTTIVDYLNTKGIPVRTVGEVMATR